MSAPAGNALAPVIHEALIKASGAWYAHCSSRHSIRNSHVLYIMTVLIWVILRYNSRRNALVAGLRVQHGVKMINTDHLIRRTKRFTPW